MAIQKRTYAPRLSVFNHKGGVGKTTLTVNLACAIAEAGSRVLLVDSDPQCNLTSYLVEEEVVDALLDNSDGEDGTTIWSALKPIVEATGTVKSIDAIELPQGIWLLPGDIRLAEFESQLATFWSECFQRRLRGFRGTTALSSLVNSVAEKIEADVVLYDSGPNIGPLNRAILLDCDYFMIPAACDLFSLRAIKTLGHTLSNWINEWQQIAELAPENIWLLPAKPHPLGYIAQDFRVYASRPSSTYAELLPRIEKSVREDVLTVLARIDSHLVEDAKAPLRIAEIKDFGSVANKAQREGVALWNSSGGTQDQRDAAKIAFAKFAETVIARTMIGLV
jgi:cellulose biosynthesis protein BcsQ